jgi:HD-like signal output (HDOD) protein
MSGDMQRVLFVDDEVAILQGLERMLFEMADEWEMVFVDRPERALSLIEASRFDVIVSDVRMPRMDGAALLARVQAEHPNIVRILLTGYSELEAIFRAMPAAHCLLTKPCKPAVLVGVLRRSCELRALLEHDSLRTLVGAVSRLPVRPETYARLTDAMSSTTAEAAEIASIVASDVALSSKVLHLTNSAFLGNRPGPLSVQEAVGFIGVRMLRELVNSAHVFTAVEPNDLMVGFSLDAAQDHALECARISRAIAGDSERAEAAFLGGMLHDIGKLVWASHARKVSRLLDEQCRSDLDLSGEESTSGSMHGRVGAYLLGLWGMDDALVQAVAYHHDPATLNSSSLDLATIVHVANALAHELENERAGVAGPSLLDLRHLKRLGLLDRLSDWRAMGRQLWEQGRR